MLPTTEGGVERNGGFDAKRLLLELPRLSKAIALFVTLLFFLGAVFPSLRSVFAITAQFFLASPTAFIKVFTAGFFEEHFMSLLVNTVVFLLEGRLMEPLWGSKEFLKYVVLVNIVSSISTYLSIVLLYMVTVNEHFLYTHRWYGFSGITAGLGVAIGQANPDLHVNLLGMYPFRAKLTPFVLVCVNLVFLLLQFQVASVPFVLFGVYYTWFYLRFVQRQGPTPGDLSPDFALSTFVPAPLSGFVDTIGRVSYKVTSLTGLWKLLGIPGLDASGQFKPFPTPVTSVSAGGGDTVDAERRRARAAQALEKRLAQMEQQKKSSGPETKAEQPEN